MTCTHVLGLIDAGPFADYPAEHLEAAWAHARQCPTCGPALQLSASLTPALRAMPEPVTPPDLAGVVMARIAQLPETVAAGAVARTGVHPAPARTLNWSGAMTLAGGLLSGIALMLATPLGPEALGELVIPRLGSISGLASMPSSAPALLAIGVGLSVYITGLFAPVRRS